MTRIASAGQHNGDTPPESYWETGAFAHGSTLRTLATHSRLRSADIRRRMRRCRAQWDACRSTQDRRAMADRLGVSLSCLHAMAKELGWPTARRGYTLRGTPIMAAFTHAISECLPPASVNEARRLWDTGLGAQRIAHALIASGMAVGDSRSVAQRIHKISQRQSWPARKPTKWNRYPEERTRRVVSARNEEEKLARYEAALRLRRPDTPCAWCDCTRPGRKCVECGRRAPERQCASA